MLCPVVLVGFVMGCVVPAAFGSLSHPFPVWPPPRHIVAMGNRVAVAPKFSIIQSNELQETLKSNNAAEASGRLDRIIGRYSSIISNVCSKVRTHSDGSSGNISNLPCTWVYLVTKRVLLKYGTNVTGVCGVDRC